MKCPKCNSDVEMMVDVTILAPSEMEGRFSKKNLRKKEVKLYAANWQRASYFCRNDKCRWVDRPSQQPIKEEGAMTYVKIMEMLFGKKIINDVKVELKGERDV